MLTVANVLVALIHALTVFGAGQVGIGLKLAVRGLKMAAFSRPGNNWRQLTGPEGLLLSLVAAVYLLVTVVKQATPPNAALATSPCETLSRGIATQGACHRYTVSVSFG